MAKTTDITLPDIGDFSDVEVIEILVGVGDRIEPEQSLLTLESDKATMEIPAPCGGRIREVQVALGAKVRQGDRLFVLEETAAPGGEVPDTEATTPPPLPAAAETPASLPEAQPEARERLVVRLPDIGDFREVPVIEILVAVGDQVEVDQSILTLESDKATMEIPAPRAGKVQALAVALGDRLSQGDPILELLAEPEAPAVPELPAEDSDNTQDPAAVPRAGARAPGEAERRQAPVLPRPEDMAAIAIGRKPHASPAVRRLARELGVDLRQVKGTGPKNRILKQDVQGYIKQALARGAGPSTDVSLPFPLAAAPEIDYSRFGEVELEDLSRIRKLSGRHLHRCWIGVPHVTQFDEADITELEAFRQTQKAEAAAAGVKLTFLPLLLKVVAKALEIMPRLKASLTGDGERLVHKKFTHIGVAVDTPDGLLVPVLRDVDRKGLYELARELATVSAKARAGKLLPGDLQGGCFSVSSLGGLGGTAFTPIVNAPEVAILGLSRAETKPVWNGREFVPRLMLPLSLSYDHRVVDGAEGVRFTTLLRTLLGDIRRLLL